MELQDGKGRDVEDHATSSSDGYESETSEVDDSSLVSKKSDLGAESAQNGGRWTTKGTDFDRRMPQNYRRSRFGRKLATKEAAKKSKRNLRSSSAPRKTAPNSKTRYISSQSETQLNDRKPTVDSVDPESLKEKLATAKLRMSGQLQTIRNLEVELGETKFALKQSQSELCDCKSRLNALERREKNALLRGSSAAEISRAYAPKPQSGLCIPPQTAERSAIRKLKVNLENFISI
jgi:hypothetical protein